MRRRRPLSISTTVKKKKNVECPENLIFGDALNNFCFEQHFEITQFEVGLGLRQTLDKMWVGHRFFQNPGSDHDDDAPRLAPHQPVPIVDGLIGLPHQNVTHIFDMQRQSFNTSAWRQP